MLNDEGIRELDFTGCIFPKIDLSRREFNKPIDFRGATFQKANFMGVKFQAEAYFISTTFQAEADFFNTEFKAAALYLDIINKGILDFSFSIFEEHLYMKPRENGYIIFHMTTFKKPNEIKLINLSLDKVSFLNTDLNGVALIPNKDSKEILDEIILREEERFNSQGSEDPLATIYDKLKGYLDRETLNLEYKTIRKCLEANRMFTEASDLYIKEMRNARKRLSNKSPEKIAHLLYDGISRYGESMSKPLSGIAIIIIISSLFISYCLNEWDIDNVTKVIAVVSQVRSFKDLGIPDKLLWLEIVIRASSLILLGNLFIALKRRLERK
jgi:uncharacterized protein YjbI with pentapeptide repeats